MNKIKFIFLKHLDSWFYIFFFLNFILLLNFTFHKMKNLYQYIVIFCIFIITICRLHINPRRRKRTKRKKKKKRNRDKRKERVRLSPWAVSQIIFLKKEFMQYSSLILYITSLRSLVIEDFQLARIKLCAASKIQQSTHLTHSNIYSIPILKRVSSGVSQLLIIL